jgi:p21-activated kinase 1
VSSAYTTSASSFALPPASVGAPFTATAVEEALANNPAGTRRPAGPQHAYTDQPTKYASPKLRQSSSFTALARTKMDTPPGTKSPRSNTNRYSDETGEASKKRHSGGGKKKGTFSSFMSNLVSSPRRPTISTPTNPMHVTHVSIDNETGEFTVRGMLARPALSYPLLPALHACAVSLSISSALTPPWWLWSASLANNV